MPSNLKDFYLNEAMRADVKTYLTDYLKALALEKMFNNEPVAGMADAMTAINKAFDDLEVMFASKSESKEINNQAR